jgi:translation elongation factor EF-Tu-like GTPase
LTFEENFIYHDKTTLTSAMTKVLSKQASGPGRETEPPAKTNEVKEENLSQ